MKILSTFFFLAPILALPQQPRSARPENEGSSPFFSCLKDNEAFNECQAENSAAGCDGDIACICKNTINSRIECYNDDFFRFNGTECEPLPALFEQELEFLRRGCEEYLDETPALTPAEVTERLKICLKDEDAFNECQEENSSAGCGGNDLACTCRAIIGFRTECYSETHFRVNGTECEPLPAIFEQDLEFVKEECARYLNPNPDEEVTSGLYSCLKDREAFDNCEADNSGADCDPNDRECSCKANVKSRTDCYSDTYFNFNGTECEALPGLFNRTLEFVKRGCEGFLGETPTEPEPKTLYDCLKDGEAFDKCEADNSGADCDPNDRECSCKATVKSRTDCYSDTYFRFDGSPVCEALPGLFNRTLEFVKRGCEGF